MQIHLAPTSNEGETVGQSCGKAGVWKRVTGSPPCSATITKTPRSRQTVQESSSSYFLVIPMPPTHSLYMNDLQVHLLYMDESWWTYLCKRFWCWDEPFAHFDLYLAQNQPTRTPHSIKNMTPCMGLTSVPYDCPGKRLARKANNLVSLI